MCLAMNVFIVTSPNVSQRLRRLSQSPVGHREASVLSPGVDSKVRVCQRRGRRSVSCERGDRGGRRRIRPTGPHEIECVYIIHHT